MDYLEAYHNRMKNNDRTLRDLSSELKSKGCKVYTIDNGQINFIKVVRGNQHAFIEFREVPYRWNLYHEFIKPDKNHGSSKTLMTCSMDLEWSAQDIIDNMAPYNTESRFLKAI